MPLVRHLKIFALADEAVVALLKGEYVATCPSLPIDAEVIGVYPNWERKAIEIMFSHPSFPVKQEGALTARATDIILNRKKGSHHA